MGSNQSAPQSLHRDDSLNGRPSDADKAIIKARRKRAKAGAQSIFGITTLIFSTAFAGFKDMKELHQHTFPMIVAIFLIVTFIATAILMKLEFFLSHREPESVWQLKAVTLVTLIAGIMFMVTDNLLLVLVHQGNAFLFFLELPEMIMLVVLAYHGMPKDRHHIVIHDDNYENMIQSASDLAVFATGVAFSMHIAILWGYMKNPSFQGHGHPQVGLSLTFSALILSLFCLMITSIPLVFHLLTKRNVLVAFISGLKKAILAILAASAVVLGEKFLEGSVLLAFLPEITIIFVYTSVEFFQREGANPTEQQNPDEQPGIFVLVATANLTLLAALHGMYGGNIDGNYNLYIKAAIFFLVSSTLSSLRCIAVRFKPPNFGGRVVMVEMVVEYIFPILEILVACSLILKIAVDLYNRL
ncbi:hypothetical protein LUZ60_011019 [Juncus effusus]|nr:hypothetical protein LUZ60_011019 [Juncus effusus]